MIDKSKDIYSFLLSIEIYSVVIPSLLILVLIFLSWRLMPCIRSIYSALRIKRHVKKLGSKTLSNIKLPDGVDGEVYIDHIVLSGEKLIVLDVKQFDGLIYGNENLDQWTQVVNQKNFQFKNPLMQIQNHVLAVRSIVPELDIEGAVLFAGSSHFPKRRPEGVLVLNDLPKRAKDTAVPDHVLSNWKQLCEYR